MSTHSGCCFIGNPGDNLERSPALLLLLPCPPPPPTSSSQLVSSVCGWGQEGEFSRKEQALWASPAFLKPGSHSFFLFPCSHIPGGCGLRHSSGPVSGFQSRSFIIWLPLTVTGFSLCVHTCQHCGTSRVIPVNPTSLRLTPTSLLPFLISPFLS